MTAENEKQAPADGEQRAPRVFLSYASEDKELAGQVANTLMENGIKVWWDEWEIRSGDSIRQKVDEGIEGCTHFLVLLTPQSIDKEWVKAEMGAAFVRKLEGKCKFIPVHYKLDVGKLPTTLRGLLSPEIESGTDLDGLISDIYEINKSPLGKPAVGTGYSLGASVVARLFVESSENGLYSDPSLTAKEIAESTQLNEKDIKDAVYELEEHAFVKLEQALGLPFAQLPVTSQRLLFIEFDRFFMPWNAKEDAKKIASDIVENSSFPSDPNKIAKHYGWDLRRLNPAINYLIKEKLIHDNFSFGIHPLATKSVKGIYPAIRLFAMGNL